MPVRSVAFMCCVASCAAVPAIAAPIGTAYKVVRSGRVAPMGFHYYLGHGCRPAGAVTVSLITPPQNGQISTAARTAYPSFSARDPLAACNHYKVAGLEVYYQSSPGFVGPDAYVVERVFPNGDAQQFRISVSVR